MRDKISIGNSGEYFVAGELERRGFTTAVPMSNVKDFDILVVSRADPAKQYCIQVKTTVYSKKEWKLAKKNEDLVGDSIVYVFIALNELGAPEYHIVPSKVVAKQIKENHEKWMSTPGKRVKQHKDGNMRVFRDKENAWLAKWDVLSPLSLPVNKLKNGGEDLRQFGLLGEDASDFPGQSVVLGEDAGRREHHHRLPEAPTAHS